MGKSFCHSCKIQCRSKLLFKVDINLLVKAVLKTKSSETIKVSLKNNQELTQSLSKIATAFCDHSLN